MALFREPLSLKLSTLTYFAALTNLTYAYECLIDESTPLPDAITSGAAGMAAEAAVQAVFDCADGTPASSMTDALLKAMEPQPPGGKARCAFLADFLPRLRGAQARMAAGFPFMVVEGTPADE